MSTTIDQIIAHLEFLGYETERRDSGAIKAVHKSHFNLIFKEYGYGVLFTAFFGINAKGKSNKSNAYERVNSFNREARVSRCYLDKDFDLVVEAYFPNLYDKSTFGVFMETLNSDFVLLGKDTVNLFDILE